MSRIVSRSSVHAVIGTAVVGATLVLGSITAMATPAPPVHPAPVPATDASLSDTGSAGGGSNEPGSPLCWLLNPSPACPFF
jgi:hypothetical protein